MQYFLLQKKEKKLKICENYSSGFCPFGPECKYKHLKSVIIGEQSSLKLLANFPDEENWIDSKYLYQRMKMQFYQPIICNKCGD
jgi:hypothetical protein